MTAEEGYLSVRLAQDDRDLTAAQRLRYRVFVQELQADGGARLQVEGNRNGGKLSEVVDRLRPGFDLHIRQ